MKTLATLTIVLPAFAALLLISCGASHSVHDESIDKDGDFGFEKLRGSDLLIAGVASGRVALPSSERVKLGGLFTNVLLEHLKGASAVRIMGTGALVARMGVDPYETLMQQCDREGMLTSEGLRTLAAEQGGGGYVLLANIVNENVADYSYEKRRDADNVETEYEKQYFMSVEFQLYDVKHEKMVWNNTVYNESERTESRTSETGCLESCTTSVLQLLLFGSPAEISREEVLEEIMQRCAENLARAKAS